MRQCLSLLILVVLSYVAGAAHAAESTPSIFTNTKCFGTVPIKKPGKYGTWPGGDPIGGAPGYEIPPFSPTGCAPTPVPPVTGRVFSLKGQTINKALPRLENYDTVEIENNNFIGGTCTAITVNPCTVKNIIIRNNRFQNWTRGSCPVAMVVYIGWQASHTNCQPNALIENNVFAGTSTFKRAIETKTSNVIIRGNVADSRLEVRHGRNLLIECNRFAGYEIFGDNHVLRNNEGGSINLGDGQVTNDEVVPHSGYPVARNIKLQGNKSPIRTFCWAHSSGPCRHKASFEIIP